MAPIDPRRVSARSQGWDLSPRLRMALLASMRRSPGQKRIARLLNSRRRIADSEMGLVMAAALLTVLLAVLVAVMLAGRTSSSWLGSIRQTEYRSAKEAAEFGFNEIAARLNTNQRCHLYVTKPGNNFATWDSVSQADLEGCNVDPVGATFGSTAAIRTGALPNFPEASYRLVSYTPPPPLRNITGTACSESGSPFANLFGGSGRMRVIGEVTRNGQVIATHTLERSFHIASVSDANRALASSSLVVTGCTNNNLGNIATRYDQNQNIQWDGLPPDANMDVVCEDTCRIGGGQGSPTLNELGADASLQVPPYPVRPSEIASVDALGSAANPVPAVGFRYYPYLTDVAPAANATVTNAGLRPECRITRNGSEISCRIQQVQGVPMLVEIRPDLLPVNLYLEPGGGRIGPTSPTGSPDGTKIVNRAFCDAVKVPECVTSSTVPINTRARLWSFMRILGSPPDPNDCTNCGDQTVTVRGGFSDIAGMFIWLPRGSVAAGPGGGVTDPLYGVIWTCSFFSQSANNRLLAPINGTNIDFLEQAFRDILSGGGGGSGGNSLVPVTKSRYRMRGAN